MNRIQRNCPLCGHEGVAIYNNVMAAVGPFDLSYEIRSCPHCQSVFSDKLAPKIDYDRYYSTMSKHDWAPVAENSDSGRCHRHLAEMIAEVAPLDSQIVDIGCGTGHLLYCLKNMGYTRLIGIDPSPQSRHMAKQFFDLDHIYTGFIDTIDDGNFLADCDVCCLTGVLEHLYAPLEQIAPVVRRLKPGARLVIGVPDLEAFTVKDREPFGELSLEHINYFSIRSLTSFLARLGCRLERCVSSPGQNESNLLALAIKQDLSIESESCQDVAVMKNYLAASEAKLGPKLAALSPHLSSETIVYGAGSHTARLLPRLDQIGLLKHCVALVDKNPNLHNGTFGGLPVLSPDDLAKRPGCRILISSFRFEAEIAVTLKDLPNTVLTIYSELSREPSA